MTRTSNRHGGTDGGPTLCASDWSYGLPRDSTLAWLAAVTDRERVRNEFERARDDFDEWISTARIPDADDRTPVPTDSLVDLVDLLSIVTGASSKTAISMQFSL